MLIRETHVGTQLIISMSFANGCDKKVKRFKIRANVVSLRFRPTAHLQSPLNPCRFLSPCYPLLLPPIVFPAASPASPTIPCFSLSPISLYATSCHPLPSFAASRCLSKPPTQQHPVFCCLAAHFTTAAFLPVFCTQSESHKAAQILL
ncbi:hypothetical protein E2C01_097790 [Portunus trituberculatus]|uniref:Uncharacterized protein n=1 Tax=Portunus trituberculatus TaxID=210409 RepID=A0A5B7K199_PORTR|nr:hypothetical protein [Portunus trituberculatus]